VKVVSKKITEEEFTEIYNRYVETIYVLCYSFMKNKHDTEDAVQESFIKLIKNGYNFSSEKHLKAWLIVTASNICKNQLRSWWNNRTDIDEYMEFPDNNMDSRRREIMEILFSMPEKYKTPVYMFYYEGYTVEEIAGILNTKENTVKTLLSRGRQILKKEIRSDLNV
jgi:RNA polymerase sigma-70 factor (ECF subfamily)